MDSDNASCKLHSFEAIGMYEAVHLLALAVEPLLAPDVLLDGRARILQRVVACPPQTHSMFALHHISIRRMLLSPQRGP